MQHSEFLVPLCCSHVLFGFFLFHILLSFLFPPQSLQTGRVLEAPFFHEPFVFLFFAAFVFFCLFFFDEVVHHGFVLFLLFFVDGLKFLGWFRISFLVLFFCDFEIFGLDEVIFEIDVIGKFKIELREVVCLEVVKVDLLELKRVVSFVFKFFHHFLEQFSALVASPMLLDDYSCSFFSILFQGLRKSINYIPYAIYSNHA
jgi:hypothetical protein